MKLVVCSVFDNKLGAYARPMFTPSRGVAIRSFQDELQRQADDNIMAKHPDDFSLHCLGTFDDENGQFEQSGVEILVSGSVAK